MRDGQMIAEIVLGYIVLNILFGSWWFTPTGIIVFLFIAGGSWGNLKKG